MKCNTCGTDNLENARFCANCGAAMTEQKPPENSLIGQTVGGRYHVVRVLGEGGMGIVYEAEQPMGSTIRKVALKTLHAHLSHDPSVSARFHRECGTIAQLDHPNTIKVYDFGATADGTLYIAMEFVAGKSLSALIEESGALPPDRVLKIMRQITGSLQEAHSQGVIHRDLKPDNVVLTQRAGETDVVKLLDFGIAARTESADAAREQKLTQQGMVLGTPPYMSPEQFTGKALDARSDIYSLGIMAYEMLTGRLPFDADTPWQWATEHMTAQPKPFEASPISSRIPATMQKAILRSLAKNRDDRQSSANQFYEELAGAAPGPQAAAAVAAGTAAMAAPPVFDVVAAGKTVAQEAVPAARTAAMGMATGPSPTAPGVPIPIPAPPSGGGHRGLVVGLASVGGLLVVGIVIVLSRSLRSGSADAAAPPSATETPPSAVVSAEPAAAETASAEPTATERSPHAAVAHHVTEPTHTATPGIPTEPSRPIEPTQPTEPARPVEPTRPPAAAGCAGCIAAANAGNIPAAASAFNGCTDPGERAACAAMVRGRALAAIQQRAFNGECGQARAIAAAAESMGIRGGGINRVLSTCQ